jgi:cell division protein FtsB
VTRIPRRIAWVALPVAAVAIGWGFWSGQQATRRAREELRALEARRAQLEQTNRDLARRVEALQHDREARAHAAREGLDVAAPGETIVILPPAPRANAKTTPAPPK